MNGPEKQRKVYTDEELDAMPAPDRADEEALELLLTRTLHPIAPPPGFAETVLRRAEMRPNLDGAGTRLTAVPARSAAGNPGGLRDRWQKARAAVLAWPGFHPQAWGAGALAAAALALAVFAGEQNHIRHEQEHALIERQAAANQQFDASVRIMDRTLEHTREELRRAGVSGLE